MNRVLQRNSYVTCLRTIDFNSSTPGQVVFCYVEVEPPPPSHDLWPAYSRAQYFVSFYRGPWISTGEMTYLNFSWGNLCFHHHHRSASSLYSIVNFLLKGVPRCECGPQKAVEGEGTFWKRETDGFGSSWIGRIISCLAVKVSLPEGGRPSHEWISCPALSWTLCSPRWLQGVLSRKQGNNETKTVTLCRNAFYLSDTDDKIAKNHIFFQYSIIFLPRLILNQETLTFERYGNKNENLSGKKQLGIRYDLYKDSANLI